MNINLMADESLKALASSGRAFVALSYVTLLTPLALFCALLDVSADFMRLASTLFSSLLLWNEKWVAVLLND